MTGCDLFWNIFVSEAKSSFENIVAKSARNDKVARVLATCFDIINDTNFCDKNLTDDVNFSSNATVSAAFYIKMKHKLCQ